MVRWNVCNEREMDTSVFAWCSYGRVNAYYFKIRNWEPFFLVRTSPHLSLVEFLSHHDTAIKYQRYIERKNDLDSRYRSPEFKTDLLMEQDASNLYTRTIFFDVQDEMLASYKFCIALNVVQSENMEKYSVRDSQFEKRELVDNVYQVSYFTASLFYIYCIIVINLVHHSLYILHHSYTSSAS